MGKHHDKIQAALEKRKASVPKGNDRAYKTPGSMNKRKTGYMGVKAQGK